MSIAYKLMRRKTNKHSSYIYFSEQSAPYTDVWSSTLTNCVDSVMQNWLSSTSYQWRHSKDLNRWIILQSNEMTRRYQVRIYSSICRLLRIHYDILRVVSCRYWGMGLRGNWIHWRQTLVTWRRWKICAYLYCSILCCKVYLLVLCYLCRHLSVRMVSWIVFCWGLIGWFFVWMRW